MFVVLHETRDNTIVQKFPLPRVLLHGQTGTTEAEYRRFFKEVVDKYVRDAISSHNEAFIDIFHNAIREAIHGFPVGQGGLAYYNIPDLSTQGTNQVNTSHQGTTTNQTQYNPGPSVQHVQ